MIGNKEQDSVVVITNDGKQFYQLIWYTIK